MQAPWNDVSLRRAKLRSIAQSRSDRRAGSRGRGYCWPIRDAAKLPQDLFAKSDFAGRAVAIVADSIGWPRRPIYSGKYRCAYQIPCSPVFLADRAAKQGGECAAHPACVGAGKSAPAISASATSVRRFKRFALPLRRLAIGVFCLARGTLISTWPKLPDRDRWPWRVSWHLRGRQGGQGGLELLPQESQSIFGCLSAFKLCPSQSDRASPYFGCSPCARRSPLA
jgi:hypothetical protein